MDAIDYALAVRDDPKIKALPWREQMTARENIWNDYVARDINTLQKYGSEGTDIIKKKFLTSVPDELAATALRGGNIDEVTPEMAQNDQVGWYNAIKINDLNEVRNGVNYDSDVVTGGYNVSPNYKKTVDSRNFAAGLGRGLSSVGLNGQIGTQLAEKVIGGNIFTAQSAKELESYRDYVNKVYGHKDIDYGLGRGIGTVASMAAMMFNFNALFGSVSEAGILTKGLQTAVKGATAGKGAILRATLPVVAQAGVEVPSGIAYNMAHSWIRGETPRIETAPGKEILSELVFFGAGEALAGVISKSLGNLGNVYNVRRALETSANIDLKRAPRSVMDDLSKAISGEAEGLGEDSIKYLNGIDPKGAAKVNQAITNARLASAKIEAGEAKEGIEEYLYKTLYNVDSVVSPDGLVTVKSFNGKDIGKVFQPEEFRTWLKTNVEEAKNVNFKDIAAMFGRRYSPTTIGVRGRTGFKVSKLDWESAVKTFNSVDGVVDVNRVKSFTKNFLGKAGDDIEVKTVDDFFKAGFEPKKGTIYIPKNLEDGLQNKAFVESFFKQMSAIDPKVKFGVKNFARYLSDIGSTAKYDKTFFEHLKDVKNFSVDKSGKVSLNFKGQDLTFGSLEEAGATVHGSYFNDEELAAWLMKEHQLEMHVEDGHYSVIEHVKKGQKPKTDGLPMTQFDSVDEFFKNSPELRPPAPIQMGPEILIVSPHSLGRGDGKMIIEGVQVFNGDVNSALRTLKRFKSTGQYKTVKQLKNGNKIEVTPNEFKYTVDFRDSGVKIETNDYNEAMEFAGINTDAFDDVEKLAFRKGLSIDLTRAGFKSTSLDGEVQAFRNTDELMNYLKKRDDLSNLSELTGQDPAVINQLAKEADPVIKEYQKSMLSALKKVATKVDHKFSRTSAGLNKSKYLETIMGRLDRTGDSTAIGFGRKLLGLNNYYHRTAAAYDKQLFSLFGRYDAHTRNVLGEIMLDNEKLNLGWTELARQRNFKLTDDMVDTLDGTRKIFDQLAGRYGVSSKLYLEKYYPHIKDINPNKFMSEDTNSKKILQDAFKTGSDADYVPFFQHMRIDELASANAFKADILSVTKTYMQAGERSLIFGDSIKEINTYLKTISSDPAQFETAKILQQLRDQVSGRVYSSESAGAIARKIMTNRVKADELLKSSKYSTDVERFNAADRLMRANTSELLNDLITSNLMSMKMRLPLRNMLQVYTTTGTLTGNTAIVKAQKRVNDNFDALHKKWTDRGVLMAREPLDPTLGLARRALKRYNSAGMNFFRTSDDATRMVTAEAWEIMFNDSMELMKANKIGYDQFSKLNWTRMLEPDDLAKFDNFMRTGQTELAGTLLSHRMTELSIFNYDSLMKPEGWKTGLGRLFGQYQTYPLQYMRFIKKVVQASDAQDLAVFTSRMLINTASVGFMLHDVMGMAGSPMTPLGTMSVTGGPWIAALARAYTGVTNYGASAVSKAKSVGREGLTLVPFMSMGKKAYQSAEAFAQGEAAVGAVYALGGSPVDEKWFDDDELMVGGLNAIFGSDISNTKYK